MEAREKIRATIESAAAALRAKDLSRLLSHYSPDSVTFSLAPPLIENDPSGLRAWFASWRGPIGWELGELAIETSGDVAFAHGLVHLRGTKLDGERPDVWFRQTVGLRRIGGEWKIAHEHHSVPFYMDGSLRAAVDLKP